MKVGASDDSYYLPAETTREPVKTLDKDAFLQLFVAQLKNQDPMSPQDTGAFMTQLAQFSMVEQLTRLNEGMMQLRRTQELEEAAVLLGKQVKVQTGDGVVEGIVEKAAVIDDEVRIFINGCGYGLDQLIEVAEVAEAAEVVEVSEVSEVSGSEANDSESGSEPDPAGESSGATTVTGR